MRGPVDIGERQAQPAICRRSGAPASRGTHDRPDTPQAAALRGFRTPALRARLGRGRRRGGLRRSLRHARGHGNLCASAFGKVDIGCSMESISFTSGRIIGLQIRDSRKTDQLCGRLLNSFDVVSIIRSPCLNSRSQSRRIKSIWCWPHSSPHRLEVFDRVRSGHFRDEFGRTGEFRFAPGRASRCWRTPSPRVSPFARRT